MWAALRMRCAALCKRGGGVSGPPLRIEGCQCGALRKMLLVRLDLSEVNPSRDFVEVKSFKLINEHATRFSIWRHAMSTGYFI